MVHKGFFPFHNNLLVINFELLERGCAHVARVDIGRAKFGRDASNDFLKQGHINRPIICHSASPDDVTALAAILVVVTVPHVGCVYEKMYYIKGL